VVSTRVLSPKLAVIWARSLILPPLEFWTAVAKTISSGLVDPKQVTQYVILAALAGPSSGPSHLVVGIADIFFSCSDRGLAGAGIARAGWQCW